MESLHYRTPNSVPLTVDDSTDIHDPVRMIYPIQRGSYMDSVAWASPSDVSTSLACRRRISSLTSTIKRA